MSDSISPSRRAPTSIIEPTYEHAHSTVSMSIVDARMMLVDPAERRRAPYMQVEPDGALRAFPIYEDTVGSLLETAVRLAAFARPAAVTTVERG